MAFNPQEHGFEAVSSRRSSVETNKCYVRLSNEKNRKHKTSLSLDPKTTQMVLGIFGDTCGVAINQEAKIVLYAGDDRKISVPKAGKRASISIETETDLIVGVLGEFRRYEYKPTIWANGEAILLTPVKVMAQQTKMAI